MPPYPDRFYSAAEYANIPGTVEMDPFAAHAGTFSDLTKLMLYSLYQQVRTQPRRSRSRIAASIRDRERKGTSVVESVKDSFQSRIGHNTRAEIKECRCRSSACICVAVYLGEGYVWEWAGISLSLIDF